MGGSEQTLSEVILGFNAEFSIQFMVGVPDNSAEEHLMPANH